MGRAAGKGEDNNHKDPVDKAADMEADKAADKEAGKGAGSYNHMDQTEGAVAGADAVAGEAGRAAGDAAAYRPI